MNTKLERHNQSYLPVYKRTVNAEYFLQQHERDNLLITSGQEDMRLQLLIKRLNQQEGTTILITSSENAENALIDAVCEGNLERRLIVASARYPTYDPLCGASKADIAAFIADIGEYLGYKDRGSVIGYFTALAKLHEVLIGKTLSLRSITDLVEQHTAAQLLQIAAEKELERTYEALQEATAGAKPFRDILTILDGEFDDFKAPSASEFSLVNAIGEPMILCIRPGGNPKLTAALLAAELRSCANKAFHLVLYEPLMLHEDSFYQITAMLKLRQNNTVSLITENLVGYSEYERLQQNVGCQIVFLDGRTNSADLQNIFDGMGSYTHFEETVSSSTPMQLLPLSFRTSQTTGVTSYTRARVLYPEIADRQAILFGHLISAADILAVSSLAIS